MGLLDGRAAVVTGGGRGIGRGHCLHLAEQGASVVVCDVGLAEHGVFGTRLEPFGLMKQPYPYHGGVQPEER